MMRCTKTRSLAALLVLGIGIVATLLWLGAHKLKDEAQLAPEPSMTPASEAFTPLDKGGHWYTSAGCISDEFYRAWDGSEVSYSHMDTSSPAQAAEQMQKWITLYSEREAERSDVLNENGKKVGERVMGLRRTDTAGRERVAVLWIKGNDFFTVEGESLERVLEFERQKVKR